MGSHCGKLVIQEEEGDQLEAEGGEGEQIHG